MGHYTGILRRLQPTLFALVFYENDILLQDVPYEVTMMQGDEKQEPFRGSFLLFLDKDYALRYNGVIRYRFSRPKEHTVYGIVN